MNRQAMTRQRILITVALAMLSIYALLSVLATREAQARLSDARADLSEVSTKIGEIERLMQAPKVAALQLESPAEISNRVAAARQAAGLPQSTLLREEPLDPQRIQRSDFELRSTTIDLAPASLTQILKFCDSLRDEETGSIVRDLRLNVPQNGSSGEKREMWEAGLTLTQMIFSPKSR